MLLGARVRAGSRSTWTAQYRWKKKKNKECGVALIWARLLSLSRIHYSGHGFWGSGWAVGAGMCCVRLKLALYSIPVCRLAAPLFHCCPAWWILAAAELCWWCSSSCSAHCSGCLTTIITHTLTQSSCTQGSHPGEVPAGSVLSCFPSDFYWPTRRWFILFALLPHLRLHNSKSLPRRWIVRMWNLEAVNKMNVSLMSQVVADDRVLIQIFQADCNKLASCLEQNQSFSHHLVIKLVSQSGGLLM